MMLLFLHHRNQALVMFGSGNEKFIRPEVSRGMNRYAQFDIQGERISYL